MRSTIYYYLGKSLYKLGFYHSAHTIFLRVAREGPASPHYNGCLSLLTRTSDILKDYDGFMSVLQGVPTTNRPRRVRSTLLYLIGLNQYLDEDFSDAVNTLDGVSVNSRFYAKAQFITGMALYRMEENRKAVRTFRDLVEARTLVGEPDEIRDIQDLAVLNMARIYYRVEDFDRAELIYDLVPRDSRYWPQALYEMAYVNFWQSDYNVALGLLLTVHSPFFAGKYYLPEVDILEALVYFNLCEYERVERIIKPYQAYTKQVRDNIRTFRKTYGIAIQGDMEAFHRDPRAMEAAMKAYARVYRTATPGEAVGIPTEVMASVESQRDFQNLHHHLVMIRKEMDLLNSGRTMWRGTALGNTLLHTLKQDAAKVRADAGRFLLIQLSQVEVDLSYLLRQSEIIYLEVVKAQKEEYEDRFRNPEYVETYEQLEHSYATESRYIFWPFTGEFWRDELGYYRFTEHGSCRTKGSK